MIDDDTKLLGGGSPTAQQSSPADGSVTINLTVTREHAEMAQQALAGASDAAMPAIDAIGRLLGLAPAAPAPKQTSSVEAQALVAGLLGGLAVKYDDRVMGSAAAKLQAHVLSQPFPAAAPAKPQSNTFRGGNGKGRARNKSKGRRRK